MTKLKKKHFPNLRIHWTDLRSIVKENESTSYSLSKEDLQKLYGISENNLYWKNYVKISKQQIRKFDIKKNFADISKIKKGINWNPKLNYKDIINKIDS